MTGRRFPTLEERAAISRRVAASHRRIAADTLAIADRIDTEAAAMEAGIDPFANAPASIPPPAPDPVITVTRREVYP